MNYCNITVIRWLERNEEVRNTPWNPMRRTRRERRWIEAYYTLSARGRSFLALFPDPRVLPDEEEDLPTSEEQARNWKEWIGERK